MQRNRSVGTRGANWVGFALGALWLGHASIGHAGPVEEFREVLLHESLPDRIVVRYDNAGGGLIVSEDGGRSFALTCLPALGEIQPARSVLDAEGTIWFAAFDGLARDDGRACAFTREPRLEQRWVADIAQHPSDPRVMFAVTSDADPTPNGIFRSQAGGAFTPLGRFEPVFVNRLRVVELPDGRVRFYESIVRGWRTLEDSSGVITAANYVIRYSDDEGQRWTEHPFAAVAGTLRLEAVDRARPERLLVSLTGPGRVVLQVSDDAGATFRPYLELATLGGVVVTPSGRVFIGAGTDPRNPTAVQGLYAAPDLATPPRLLSSAYAVTCLGHRATDDTLFMCDRWRFGRADPDDGRFSVLVRLDTVERMIDCRGRDVRAACRDELLRGYCGETHFPCAPVCDAYAVDLSALAEAAADDPALAQCFARRAGARYTAARDPDGDEPDAETAKLPAGWPAADGGGSRDARDAERSPRSARYGCTLTDAAPGRDPSWFESLLCLVGAGWLVQRRSRRLRRGTSGPA